MTNPDLTAEQKELLERHVAGIGHNLGPRLNEQADEIQKRVAGHHRLRAEATTIRVMLDMMRAHLSGEYLLPQRVSAYVASGLVLVCAITGISIAAEPVGAILLDAVVIGFIITTLRGEIQKYVDWRCMRDPSYAAVRRELDGG